MQMTCPKCQSAMRQYERSGVIVDQCDGCRGIFLDRGELERLVDAENTWRGRQVPPPAHVHQPHRDYDSDEYPVYGGQPGHYGKRKRRGSFLEGLFD
jgi:Zn-finger nucleic acid-binding protein